MDENRVNWNIHNVKAFSIIGMWNKLIDCGIGIAT